MLKFTEFTSSSLQEDSENMFEIDLTTYYVYFIVYPSPTNPSQANLYIGVKHLDSGSTSEHSANDFFGGIRSTGAGNTFTDGGSKFEKSILIFNPESRGSRVRTPNGSLSENDKLLYMSSCSYDKAEALKHAYAKGIYMKTDADLVYNPLICNNKLYNYANSAAKKDSGIEIVDHFVSRMKDFIKKVSSKPKKKNDDVEETKDEKEATTVKEDAGLGSSISNHFIPISLSQGKLDPKNHIEYARSKNYGYRIYVCDDMSAYVKVLSNIIDTEESATKNKDTSTSNLETTGLKNEKNKWYTGKDGEIPDEIVNVVAKGIAIRHYDTLLHVYGSQKLGFKDIDEYEFFMRKQIRKYPNPILSQIPEKTMFKAQGDIGKLYQAANAPSIVRTDEVVRNYYCPDNWTKQMREEASTYFSDKYPQKRVIFKEKEAERKEIENEKERGSATYSIADLHANFEKIEKEDNKGKYQKEAIQNFLPLTNSTPNSRDYGVVGGDSKNIGSFFWNSENNLLKKAYEGKDFKAIQAMKKVFLEYDLKVMIPHNVKITGMRNKELRVLGLVVKTNGKNCYVIKQGNELVEKTVADILNEGKWRKTREKIFNLYDFLKMIGYSNAQPQESLIDFVQKNKLLKEEYIELTEAKEEIKFRKSSQSSKYDTIAIGFIKGLFEGSNQFKTIFFDNGNGEKPVTLEEAREILSKPVVKLIESGKLKQTETEKKLETEKEKKTKTEKKPQTKSTLVKGYLDKAKEGGKKFLDGLISGALDMQTASYEEDPDAKVITEKKLKSFKEVKDKDNES